MPENLLTDTKIKSAKPTDRDRKLSDGGGLFLLVKANSGGGSTASKARKTSLPSAAFLK